MIGEVQVLAKCPNAEIASPASAGAGFAGRLAMTSVGEKPTTGATAEGLLCETKPISGGDKCTLTAVQEEGYERES